MIQNRKILAALFFVSTTKTDNLRAGHIPELKNGFLAKLLEVSEDEFSKDFNKTIDRKLIFCGESTYRGYR